MFLELFVIIFLKPIDIIGEKWYNHCVNKSEAAISAIFAKLSF